MEKQNQLDVLSGERGVSLIELALMLPIFLLLMFGALDFGRAFYLETELAGAAHAAAMYGSQNPTDTTGMQTAAQDDAPDVTGLSIGTATYGCECSDGSGYSASCASMPTCSSTTLVYRVNVSVSTTYKAYFPWPAIPSTMTLSSAASARSAGS